MFALRLTGVIYESKTFHATRIAARSKARLHSDMGRSCSSIIVVLFPTVIFALHGCASVPDNYPAQWPERLYTSGQGFSGKRDTKAKALDRNDR